MENAEKEMDRAFHREYAYETLLSIFLISFTIISVFYLAFWFIGPVAIFFEKLHPFFIKSNISPIITVLDIVFCFVITIIWFLKKKWTKREISATKNYRSAREDYTRAVLHSGRK